MSYLLNTAVGFTDDMVAGFVRAHPDMVRRVDGGVVRAAGTPRGQVAVVIGGGSGHYPAFAGLVGLGLAHAAAMGNVFASPSTQQIRSVAAAADAGAGVLFSYGNYAGDVINFDQAQARLNADGIPTRTVTVTDDVSSAASGERALRRGVAGDLMVFRAAAWAAEQGRSLDGVWTLADRANRSARTLGVAFSGCTLPGADAPLFSVPTGTMAVGMGIHGEPGIEERPLGSADDVAAVLVAQLLAERPDDTDLSIGDRVAVMVNGLGSVKSEELYVLYASIARLLDDAGLVQVHPEIGEFATSFEMAGVSLSLMWLDDELEQSWCAPAAAPGYRRGAITTTVAAVVADAPVQADERLARGSGTSREAAAVLVRALREVRRRLDEEVDELGRLDAIAGDGDHGIGMQRGITAAVGAAEAAAEAGAGAGTVLTRAADAWADRAGGTSGALWGRFLRAAGELIGDDAGIDADALVAATRAAVAAVAEAGGAEAGDKTMLDAMLPFADRLADGVGSGHSPLEAWRVATVAAQAAADASADLVPRRGRARTHTTRSIGTPDPGAVSFAHIVAAAAGSFANTRTGS